MTLTEQQPVEILDVPEVQDIQVSEQVPDVENQVLEQEPPTLAQLISAGELTSIPITNENVSLNVIVAFLNLASRRGVYSIEENAKIWECIQYFVQSK